MQKSLIMTFDDRLLEVVSVRRTFIGVGAPCQELDKFSTMPNIPVRRNEDLAYPGETSSTEEDIEEDAELPRFKVHTLLLCAVLNVDPTDNPDPTGPPLTVLPENFTPPDVADIPAVMPLRLLTAE